MHISEMQEKILKKSFVFEAMALQVVGEIQHVLTGILVIGSQCLNKQRQDFRSDYSRLCPA